MTNCPKVNQENYSPKNFFEAWEVNSRGYIASSCLVNRKHIPELKYASERIASLQSLLCFGNVSNTDLIPCDTPFKITISQRIFLICAEPTIALCSGVPHGDMEPHNSKCRLLLLKHEQEEKFYGIWGREHMKENDHVRHNNGPQENKR